MADNVPARRGRPPVELAPLEVKRLTALGALGMNQELVAGRLGIAPKTLRRILREDEDAEAAWLLGRAEAAEEALELLWKSARKGDIAARIFLGKCLAGLRETGTFGGEGGGGGQPVNIAFQIVNGTGDVRELKRVNPGEWTEGAEGETDE